MKNKMNERGIKLNKGKGGITAYWEEFGFRFPTPAGKITTGTFNPRHSDKNIKINKR